MSKRRVVVTGLGIVSPLGADVSSNWKSLTEGRSGITTVERFDVSRLATRFAGLIEDFPCEGIITAKEARRMDLFIRYAIFAADQAVRDAGLLEFNDSPERYAVYVGSGIGGIGTIEENVLVLHKDGPRRISPFFVPGSIINMASGSISIRYGFQGANIGIATACTTGTHSIGYGMRSILLDEADVAVVGGAEAPVTYLGMAGFVAARSLSSRNEAPQEASRPWDKDRDGFVLGEGAGVLILEEYEHARARSANIYAELTGFGVSADAWHITAPPVNGEGAVLAMSASLRSAGLNPADISYINAHGTSTSLGDLAEVRAIKSVFGGKSEVPAVSSTKSMTGHLLGAAGAIEAIYSVMALKEQTAPPTINLDHPDEECDLDFLADGTRRLKIDKVLSNSFGFGGTNGSLIFSRV